jgi:hypothetical protein
MSFKSIKLAITLIIGLISVPNVWAATCGNFILNADPHSSGSITCAGTNSGNIHYKSGTNVVESPSGTTLFSNVIDLSGEVTGLYDRAPNVGGFGTFNIMASVWNTWDSVYLALKQGNQKKGGGYALFLLTKTVDSGTWHTAPGNGTRLSHYLAFGGMPASFHEEVPIPAAIWLFGSAFVGLLGIARKNKIQ